MERLDLTSKMTESTHLMRTESSNMLNRWIERTDKTSKGLERTRLITQRTTSTYMLALNSRIERTDMTSKRMEMTDMTT